MSTNEQILAEFKKKDSAQLLPMVETGQVTQLLEEGRKITGIMSACLVSATEERAWETLLDYDSYRRFMPGIQTSKVLSRKDDEIVVKFVAGVKVMGIGGMVKYTYRFKINKPYADVYDTEKHELCGYWAILPTPDKNKIILVHADVAKDVKSIHMFIRFLIERLPSAELGLHLAPVAMLVNRVKERMEKRG